jgi:hypothetical protein
LRQENILKIEAIFLKLIMTAEDQNENAAVPLHIVDDGSDIDIESHPEDQLLLQQDKAADWTPPRGFLWIQVGMLPNNKRLVLPEH